MTPTSGAGVAHDDTAAIVRLLGGYFDGLYEGDTARLAAVFHPRATYATAVGGTLVHLTLDEYLPVVAARQAPAARGERRRDRVTAIRLVGPATALAEVECAIGDRFFRDLLSLVRVDGRWQIIAKVFDYETQGA
jgi:hypothetical protein